MLRILSLPFSPLSLLKINVACQSSAKCGDLFLFMSTGLAVSFVKDGGFHS